MRNAHFILEDESAHSLDLYKILSLDYILKLNLNLKSKILSLDYIFIALLRVFGFAAVCLGCLDSNFLLKRASEFPFGVGLSVLDKVAKVLCYF